MILLTGKDGVNKAKKTVYIGSNISLRQSTTNINYQYENMSTKNCKIHELWGTIKKQYLTKTLNH